MSERRLDPPGGDLAPTTGWLGDDTPLSLTPLAEEICRRYRLEFPDEQARYGGAGDAWCVHDNQYILFWGAEAVSGYLDMNSEVAWLATVLEAREFPLARLARGLDIGAEVARSHLSGTPGEQLANVLADAAAFVRSHGTFRE